MAGSCRRPRAEGPPIADQGDIGTAEQQVGRTRVRGGGYEFGGGYQVGSVDSEVVHRRYASAQQSSAQRLVLFQHHLLQTGLELLHARA